MACSGMFSEVASTQESSSLLSVDFFCTSLSSQLASAVIFGNSVQLQTVKSPDSTLGIPFNVGSKDCVISTSPFRAMLMLGLRAKAISTSPFGAMLMQGLRTGPYSADLTVSPLP